MDFVFLCILIKEVWEFEDVRSLDNSGVGLTVLLHQIQKLFFALLDCCFELELKLK